MYSQNRKFTPGLTLIEMLIAMTLLATILSMLGGAFFQSDKAAKKIDYKISYRKKIRNLKSIIARDFSGAVYLTNFALRKNPGDPENDTGIIGRRRPESNPRLDQVFLHTHNFSLYHNELEPYQDPEVHEVGYFLGKTRYNHVYRLYRREDYYIDSKFDLPDENPYQNDEVLDTNKSITHFLTDDILYFEVQYLEDPVAADEATQQEGNTAVEGAENQTKKGWTDTWKSAERSALRLPYAVRITVKFPLVTPEELNEMTEVPWDDPAVVASETFEVPIRWKPEAGISWSF